MRFAVFSQGIDLQSGPISDLFEDSLRSAIIVSLLTDRRADPQDTLPDDTSSATGIPPDRRGWAGDALAEADGDRIGSRLWLLSREKQTEETRRRAIEYAQEALDWLVQDKHATDVDVTAEWSAEGGAAGRLNLQVVLILVGGESLSVSLSVGAVYAI